MLKSKSFLAVDFGAGSLKVAEFQPNEAGGLRLSRYGMRSLGAEGAQESTRELAMLRGLQELLASDSFGSKEINVCAPGFHVFSKFVKLPPVDTSKVTQIIQYEAQQNVPFPLEEVVWDYQILGTSTSGELEVLLVAIKTDIVEGLFRVAEGAGLHLQLVDVSPAALCNAFRYNYGDLEGCTMLLDIGAKTSNLLFFENGKVYSRSINIGANSITQDFATEAKIKFAEAEAIKIEKGFVSLGGAYEEPEDPQAAAISKIARQVMTRLHIQVNQTIQFYRGQQGGSVPQRLFLSGGASIMPYTAQFFTEKLNIPVDYFNPFRNVQIDPEINLEDLARVAHSFGEVVGLALRNLAHCPVELNLMPKSSIQWQQFAQKKPFLIAAMYTLVLVVFAVAWSYSRVVAIKQSALDDLDMKVQPLLQKEGELGSVNRELGQVKKEADQVVGIIKDRFYWADLLSELRRVMEQAEGKTKQKLGTDTGIWVESFFPVLPASSGTAGFEGHAFSSGEGVPDEFAARYSPPEESAQQVEAAPGSENEVSLVNMICRSVNLDHVFPAASSEIAYALEAEINNSPFFAADGTKLGAIKNDETSPTFTFELTLKLKTPFKFNYVVD